MASIIAQNPGSSEIQSPLIAGITDGLNKISAVLDLKTSSFSDVPLESVYIDETPENRNRIYEAPSGKRLWLSNPQPIIKLNGVVIGGSYSFEIDYVGGSVTFGSTYKPNDSDSITASFTCVEGASKALEGISEILLGTKEQSDKYKGSFVSLDSLNIAFPMANKDDFAIVLSSPPAVYTWNNSKWENTQSIEDLSGYYTKDEADDIFNTKEGSISPQGSSSDSDSYYFGGRKTWQDLKAHVRNTNLAGLSYNDSARVTETDTVLAAIGKLQKQTDIGVARHYITGSGAPTASTAGIIGQRYVNTSNNDEYICISVSGNTYGWRLEPKTVNGKSPAIGGNITLSAGDVGAYSKQETDNAVNGAKSNSYTIAVPASGWAGSAPPYTNTVAVAGVTASTALSVITLEPSLVGNAAAQKAMQAWRDLDTQAGKVVLRSDTKPTADFVMIAKEVK